MGVTITLSSQKLQTLEMTHYNDMHFDTRNQHPLY